MFFRADELSNAASKLQQANSTEQKMQTQIVHLENDLMNEKVTKICFYQSAHAMHIHIHAQLKESHRTQEIELLNKQLEWLNKELNSRSEEFVNYRRTKSEIISHLEVSNEDLIRQQQQQTDRLRSQEAQLASVNTQLEATIAKLKQVTDEAKTSEELFKAEMAAQKRLAQVYEEDSTSTRTRLNELEGIQSPKKLSRPRLRFSCAEECRSAVRRNEEATLQLRELTAQHKVEIEKYKHEKEAHEKRLAQLEKELQNANDLIKSNEVDKLISTVV